MGSYISKTDDFEIINNNQEIIQECFQDYQLINQVQRKIKLLNEYKEEIANTTKDSVYHTHMLGALEYESSSDGQLMIYSIRSNLFYTLFKYKINDISYNIDYLV